MALLKAVRSQQGAYRADSYEDGAAYFALMGEAAVQERNGGWTDEEIEAAAFKHTPTEHEAEEFDLGEPLTKEQLSHGLLETTLARSIGRYGRDERFILSLRWISSPL